MSFRDRVAAWMRRGMPDDDPDFEGAVTVNPDTAAPESPPAPPPPPPPPSPPPPPPPGPSATMSQQESSAAQAELDRLRRENETLRKQVAERTRQEARDFASAQAAAGKIDPAEVPFLTFLYEQAAAHDYACALEGALIQAVDGVSIPVASRTAAFRLAFDRRPVIAHRRERLATDPELAGKLRLLDNGASGTADPDSPEAVYRDAAERAKRLNRA